MISPSFYRCRLKWCRLNFNFKNKFLKLFRTTGWSYMRWAWVNECESLQVLLCKIIRYCAGLFKVSSVLARVYYSFSNILGSLLVRSMTFSPSTRLLILKYWRLDSKTIRHYSCEAPTKICSLICITTRRTDAELWMTSSHLYKHW